MTSERMTVSEFDFTELNAIVKRRHETGDYGRARIEMSRDVSDGLLSLATVPTSRDLPDSLLGIPVYVDESLAPGAWRLVADDDGEADVYQERVRRILGGAFPNLDPILTGEVPIEPPWRIEAEREVHKWAAYVPVSTDQALEYRLITEDEARAQGWMPWTRPPVSWWRRFRLDLASRWFTVRLRVGRAVGNRIAGVNLSDYDHE